MQLARPVRMVLGIGCPSLGLTHQHWLSKHCSTLYNPRSSHTGRNPATCMGFSPRASSWQSVTEGREETNQPVNYKIHDSSRQRKAYLDFLSPLKWCPTKQAEKGMTFQTIHYFLIVALPCPETHHTAQQWSWLGCASGWGKLLQTETEDKGILGRKI